MIINALTAYYELLAQDEDHAIPRYGYSSAKVSFALVISSKGELLQVISLEKSSARGKRTIPRSLTVPQQAKRAAGTKPNFMCDNSSYLLGIDQKGKEVRGRKRFEASKELHLQLLQNASGEAAQAVVAFFNNWNVEATKEHPALSHCWEDILAGSNLVFHLDGKAGFLHNDPEIKKIWETYHVGQADVIGQCLVTGQMGPVARLHPSIKGVKGAQSSGASIVSFNDQSYESYGKSQGYNAPVSRYAAFAYTTVLNQMLANPKQHIQVGDATTVFWAESANTIYTDMAAAFFNPALPAANQGDVRQRDADMEDLVRDVLSKAKTGDRIADFDGKIDESVRFYILGLSPNSARISIRYFFAQSFGSFVERIAQHYRDLEIVKDFDGRPDNIPLWMLLQETVSPKSSKKEVKPLLAGAVMNAIVSGKPYPAALYSAIITRMRHDMDDKDKGVHRINYVRAAIIKAYLLRLARVRNDTSLKEVLTVSLNESSTNTAYLLGRLFAVLEKAQQDANPGINTTIKDRYFSSASTNPASVFPLLLRLAQHHIAKSDYGHSIEKRIEPIVNQIERFPSFLTLEQQGTFMLGYYHQRAALFQKKDKPSKEE